MLTSISSLLTAAFMALTPAAAASSSWADLGGGKARVVADFDPASGQIKGAIEVKLDQGWSTYWRYPGSTGIPPQFDFSSSQNISFGQVHFPTPSLQTSGGARYAGYKGTVIFPFEGGVSTGKLPSLNIDMLIGVCEEICIPAKAGFNISSDQFLQSDPVAKRIISFSKLKMPKQMSINEASVELERLEEGLLEISLTAPGDSNEKPELFVEGPSDWYLTPAHFQHTKDKKLVFHLDLLSIPKNQEVTQDQLLLTLVSGRTGFEIRD